MTERPRPPAPPAETVPHVVTDLRHRLEADRRSMRELDVKIERLHAEITAARDDRRDFRERIEQTTAVLDSLGAPTEPETPLERVGRDIGESFAAMGRIVATGTAQARATERPA